jgi:SAM-dependent methyltransferase
MRERFETIYRTNEWGEGCGSGLGAMPKWTGPYRRYVQYFIKAQKVRSVVDVGCGDWQSSRLMNWSGIDYLGLDVVPFLVEKNIKEYGSPTIRFRVRESHTEPLPEADLLLVKDVMQHWSDKSIQEFLPLMRSCRYALITNEVATKGKTVHRDIKDGGSGRWTSQGRRSTYGV